MRSAFREELLWPPSRRELTLLALPDLTYDQELNTLITDMRALAKTFPAIDRPVPDEWLHVTMQAINHTLDDPGISPVARQVLIAELETLFAVTPAFTIRIGSVLAYGGGMMTDADLDEPFTDLVGHVRKTIAKICGDRSIEYDSRPAHMMLSYSHGDVEVSEMQARIRRIRPGHAPMTVNTIVLAEVAQDPEQCVYRWEELHRFKLRLPSPNNACG